MSKLTTLADAVASVPSGAHLALSGFAITRCTMAFAREVIRQGIKGLTISQCVGAMDADLLVGAGCVDRIIYGGGSLDRFGRLACVNRGIEDGSLRAEEYSSLSVTFRYLAGALGIPFMPIRSLRGSDLARQLEERSGSDVAMITDPFSGETWLALKPLKPDVAVVQVQLADQEGNAQIMGPRWDNAEQARASQRTIVIAEQIVRDDVIRSRPELTVIPGLLVSHVVEVPYGAHPTSVYGLYDYDAREIERYVEGTKTPESLRGYLQETVYGPKDHGGYLASIGGMERMAKLRADPSLGY
jgi:acyl CoA:acetate/3-ketoacid CoA transferase alpha subunit